jgi:hypothetical protein
MKLLIIHISSDPSLGPDIHLSALSLNIFSLCSNLCGRDQILDSHKVTDNIIILHILIFTLLDNRN